MKKMIVSALLAASCAAIAQKTDKVSLDYQMTFYPLNMISNDANVDIECTSNYKEMRDSRVAEVEKMKADEAGKSTGKKMFEKALTATVFDPKNPTPESIFIPTLIEDETVGQIKIPGYTENNTSKGKVKIVFYPLDISNMSSTGFLYTPLKADITIINDKGTTVYQGTQGVIKGAHTYTFGPSEKLQDAYKKSEAKAKEETLTQINAFLKSDYGYLTQKDDRRFYDVKDKKFQYPEYHTALEKVKTSFAFMGVSSKKSECETNLKEAITLWEESLKSFDKTNKEAKINKDIAAATYLNIAETYIWLNNFDKSKEALAQYTLLDEDYSKTEKGISKFLDDYSKRYTAYSKYQ